VHLSRRLLAVPTAVVLLWGLTACGGATPEADSEPTAAPSASATSEVTPEGVELTTANFLESIMAAQIAAGSYDFTMTMTGGVDESLDASGTAHVGTDAQSFTMTMQLPDSDPVEMRSTGGMTYVKLGELTGGKFLQIDPNDTSNPLAAEFGDILGELDPSKELAEHEGSIAGVTKKGDPEDLDGVQVQEYEVVIDVTKLPEQLAELEKSLPAGTEPPSTLTYSYWVDSENRARRLVFSIMGAHAEMTFTNWGTAAPVVAPSAEEISTDNPFAG
jgi:hypothetical protein